MYSESAMESRMRKSSAYQLYISQLRKASGAYNVRSPPAKGEDTMRTRPVGLSIHTAPLERHKHHVLFSLLHRIEGTLCPIDSL